MAKRNPKSLAPENVQVKNILTSQLIPNPHNPRMLFDRLPLDILRGSIAKVGILVPLTVYWNKAKGAFIILDGQRRWLCAKELNLKTVPVNQVAEPSIVQNIVTMFQIHKLREDWELMPTALKLEVLMKELGETRENRLAELTGLDQAVVTRCKKLLSYSKKFQDLMLEFDPNKRIKADFFIELYSVRNDRVVNKMAWFSKNTFTTKMLDKYQNKKSGIKAVTDFRLMKQYISNAVRAKHINEITKRLREFTADDNLTLNHLLIRSADVSANARKLIGEIEKIKTAIYSIDVKEFYGEEELWEKLEKLAILIQSKLREAGRRTRP